MSEQDGPWKLTMGDGFEMSVCGCGAVFRARGSQDVIAGMRQDFWAKHQDCAEKKREGRKVFYLSFCDGERPKGQQFLGACLVEVSGAEADAEVLTLMLRFPLAEHDSEWLAAAITKSHQLGCNPGGEVASHEVELDNPALKFFPLGALLSRLDIERLDAEVSAAQSNS